MRGLNRVLILQLMLVLFVPGVTLAADSAKDPPLIGTWLLNVAKSTYPGTPPKSQVRTFDYTRDGLILVAYETVNAQGARSFAHWYLSLDGKDQLEFSRATGATPTFWLAGRSSTRTRKKYEIGASRQKAGRRSSSCTPWPCRPTVRR